MTKAQTLIDSLTPIQQTFLKHTALGVVVRANDAPRKFTAFYELVFERPLPDHARDEWLPPLVGPEACDYELPISEVLGLVIVALVKRSEQGRKAAQARWGKVCAENSG